MRISYIVDSKKLSWLNRSQIVTIGSRFLFMGLQLRYFGNPKIDQDGREVVGFRSRKAQALLCYLVVTGRHHSRAHLASLLWADMPETNAAMNLRKTLMNLRELLGAQLETDRRQIAFSQDLPYWSDVATFEAGVSLLRVDPMLSATNINQVAQAAELYTADFLEGFYLRDAPLFETWMSAQQIRLRDLLLHTLREMTSYYAERRTYTIAVESAKRLLSFEPFDEAAQRTLILLLAHADQRMAALTQYESYYRALTDELGVEPAPETNALYQAIQSGKVPDFPEGQAPSSHSAPIVVAASHKQPEASIWNNLPTYNTLFVGRRKELREIRKLMLDPKCCLLTLMGLGGIGKTRLAVEVIKQDYDRFKDGIVFIPTAAIRSTDALITKIADTLGFSFYAAAPAEIQLQDYLREKDVLLVLDSFEHLLESSNLITGILQTTSNVKFLVTSREALRLQEEWVYSISGLEFPADETTDDFTLDTYDAVQLFAQNATRARVEFSFSQEREHVLQICRLLEGMPLGIELAASWLRTIPCSQIAQQIAQGLDILVTPLRNLPERHRSMRAVFEQSWLLLPETARHVLKRLSVFHSGFTSDAAQQVVFASQALLNELVTRSLVQFSYSGRYQMHELLRQFAEEKLKANPEEWLQVQNLHADYYLTFLRHQADPLEGDHQKEALTVISDEIENIRVSWYHALDQGNWAALDQALDRLFHFFEVRSRFEEGVQAFSSAIARLSQADQAKSPSLLGRILSRQAAFYLALGRYQEAEKLAQKSIDLARALDDKGELAFCLNLLGEAAYWQGQVNTAKRFHQESLAISRESGDPVRIVHALVKLGETSEHLGEWEEAKNCFLESLAINRKIGLQNLVANALDKLGAVSFYEGNYQASALYYEESYAIFKELGDRLGMSLTLGGLGFQAWAQGEVGLARATALLEESLALSRAIDHPIGISTRLGILGTIANSAGEYTKALHYAQEALVVAKRVKSPVFTIYALSGLGGAAYGLNDFPASRRYLREALQATVQGRQLYSQVGFILLYYAQLLVKEHNQDESEPSEGETKLRQAAKLLYFVLYNHNGWQVIKDEARRFLASLTAVEPTRELQAPTITWEEVLEIILGNSDHDSTAHHLER